MSNIRNLTFKVLIILTLVYCMGTGLYSSLGVYYSRPSDKPDYVSAWESRLADLKKEIPSSEEKIGYISDWDINGYDKDAYIEFVLTQYTLAPIFVERNLNHEWIVANSHSDGFLTWLAGQMTEAYTIRSFGNGIYLIHKGAE